MHAPFFYHTFATLNFETMNSRRAYEIAFVGLKPGVHEYNYEIGDKFFQAYGEQDFTNCHANVKLLLDKQNGFMLLKFDVDGKADMICDRCGNELTVKLWDEFNIVVKMVDEPEKMNDTEEDPDVYYISRTESHIFVGDWIYEFINLSIPLQKVCADDVNEKSTCNEEALSKLEQMRSENENAAKPIWKGLEQFKDLQ